MTDLERLEDVLIAHDDLAHGLQVIAVLRALKTPSPEVVEAMAKAAYTAAYLGNGPHHSWETIVKCDNPDIWREAALAAWRAGIAALIKSGGGAG